MEDKKGYTNPRKKVVELAEEDFRLEMRDLIAHYNLNEMEILFILGTYVEQIIKDKADGR